MVVIVNALNMWAPDSHLSTRISGGSHSDTVYHLINCIWHSLTKAHDHLKQTTAHSNDTKEIMRFISHKLGHMWVDLESP